VTEPITGEYPARRHKHRREDPLPIRVASIFMRWRGVGSMVGWIGGAGGMALAMRFFLASRLSVVEVRSIRTDSTVSELKSGQQVLLKGQCLDRTSAEQALLGLVCPSSLYKGVLEGKIP
jgi:hypothetical protein